MDREDDNGRTPLMVAILRGNVGEIERMLSVVAEPDVNAVDGHLKTALHHAVDVDKEHDSAKLCRALMAKGARVGVADAFGRTPLHCAVARGRLGVLDALLSGVLDATTVNIADRNGNTALHLAAALERPTVALAAVQALLAKGADPLQRNGEGQIAGNT